MAEDEVWKAIDAIRTEFAGFRERMARMEAEAEATQMTLRRVETTINALSIKLDGIAIAIAAKDGGAGALKWLMGSMVAVLAALGTWLAMLLKLRS